MKNSILFICLLASISIFAQQKPEGLFVNARAPEFKAKDQSGVDINLKELRKKGSVVLFFYRGNWCPYCSKELLRLQDSLSLITAAGAQLVAITAEASEGINKTIEKTKAIFPIIHDQEMKISNAYKVSFAVDEKSVNRYKSFGTDLLNINQQKGTVTLPVPALYIINKEGSITYRYFNEDFRQRPWVKDILQELN